MLDRSVKSMKPAKISFYGNHARVYRRAVVFNVQIISSKVDYTAPFRVLDVGVLDVPFLRDRPIKDTVFRVGTSWVVEWNEIRQVEIRLCRVHLR